MHNNLQKLLEILISKIDSTDKYLPVDIDESGDPKYYGFLSRNGDWYIMKISGGNIIRYVAGNTQGYQTAWTGRAGLTYDYPLNIK